MIPLRVIKCSDAVRAQYCKSHTHILRFDEAALQRELRAAYVSELVVALTDEEASLGHCAQLVVHGYGCPSQGKSLLRISDADTACCCVGSSDFAPSTHDPRPCATDPLRAGVVNVCLL